MSANRSLHPAAPPEPDLYRRVTLRFVPLLFLCFVFNYIDRTNIGFAQLQMKGDLGFTDVQYGLGAGIFFVSYSLFAVPSNLLMIRIGARKLIFVSLVTWGLISSLTLFIRTPHQFYAIRFLLGTVESGFFPGIIYYFTRWFPPSRRANATGIFQSATVVAGIVSGVLSGTIMTWMNGYHGLRGWQWMFLLEGLPSMVMGMLVLFWLDDGPSEAKWLSPAEKASLLRALEHDPVASAGHTKLARALLDWRVYMLGLIFFLAVIGTYVLAFWQPAMIHELGVASPMTIGLYSTLPALAAVITKIGIGWRSDRKKELRWHFAVPALAGALGMALMPLFPHSPLLGIACLSLAMAGVHGCIPVFWSLPGLYLSGAAAAGGIALISTMGNTAGAVGPIVLGFIRKQTGSFSDGMYWMSALLVLGAILVLGLFPAKRPRALARADDARPGHQEPELPAAEAAGE
ncbi:MAG TPA: MFS transporter [Acidobacteriaceae bacterium]|jgi:MFS family permease|nr:MFS transporter [Acidobacteriaceae bacterium]